MSTLSAHLLLDALPVIEALTLGPHATRAGSGKTTTCIALVHRLASLNHKHLTYVSFTKSAVGDAQRRFEMAIVGCNVNCRTLNSLAWHVAIQNGRDVEADADVAMNAPSQIDEGALEDLIRTSLCRAEITRFLQGVSARDLAGETKSVARFIYKTFEAFCKGALPLHKGFDPQQFGTCYYPAVLYHKGEKSRLKPGVPQWQNFPKNIEPFYVGCAKKVRRPNQITTTTITLLPSLTTTTCCHRSPPPRTFLPSLTTYIITCCQVWDHCMKRHVYTYLSSVKHAQLQDAVIPGTALVLDEAQDTNPCALAWIAQQRARMQVYLVGDLAQSIYSFTGAKPQVRAATRLSHRDNTMC